jgi:hypothetical protein
MEYIGNQPPPPNPYQYDDNYWWNYNPYGNIGGYDPYSAPVTSWQDQIAQSGGTAPPQNPDVDANGNPIFRTDVVGNAPPVETTGSDIGQLDPNLANYLASLSGGGTPGSTGANFSTTGWDVADWGGGETGGDPTKTRPPINGPSITTPPNEDGGERGNTYTYFSDPSFGDPTRGNTYTYFTDPSAKDYHTYFAPVPTTPPSTKPPIVPPWIGGPLDTPKPPPPPPQQTGGGQQPGGGQQQQKPGVGGLLAALPMLAAFQGGTTTTPAPYAHLGPHTPVAPVFKPQGRSNPIPSIGQLLAGVR